MKETGWVNLILMILDGILFRIYYHMGIRSIICDRYFYDVWISHLYRGGPNFPMRLVKSVFPVPDLSVFLEVDVNAARQREKDDYHSELYFREKEKLYKEYSNQFADIKLQNIKLVENQKVICSLIEKLMAN